MGAITTIDFPVELPVVKKGERWIARSGDKELSLSNLDKIYFPEEGFTKGDVLTYYFNISPTMLPHLVDRPLTLKRMPNGIHSDFFYEKNASPQTPDWIRTIPVKSETKVINYLSASDPADVLYIANLGCIEFHPLHGKGPDQSHPTYAFFDLDPMEGSGWEEVRYVAGLVKVMLDQLDIESYPKTSGATGMQIMVPLDGTHDYLDVRRFVGAVSRLVHQADKGETTSMEWEVARRGPKVYLDVNMNREGANIAAVYSLRPVPEGTVSTPFEWDELSEVHPKLYTMSTIFDRIAEVGDVFLPVAEGPGQSLDTALEALEPAIEAFNISGKVTGRVPR
ncbi:MAG: bifunctional non-ous end joining protein LigD [Actinomycetota bacterium]|jgi:bifunctional non-homologous end joining protein LigD|nr:bifunctional non-ous end joining protein LigD [Actinomycetota bacterium]